MSLVALTIIIKWLRLALFRLSSAFSFSCADPSHQQLLQYVTGVRQIVQLSLSLDDLGTDTSASDEETLPSPEKLHEVREYAACAGMLSAHLYS